MKRVDVSSALITDSEGHILIVKNVKGDSSYWSLPGGAVEAGETLEQAAIREVKEETGYGIVITGLCSLREMFFAERGHHALIVTFFADIIEGNIVIDDPDNDITDVKWVDLKLASELMPSFFQNHSFDSVTDRPPAFYVFEGLV